MQPVVCDPVELRRRPCRPHHFTGPECAQLAPGNGSVSVVEGEILAAVAAALGGPVLEIGTSHGVSTRFIHEGLGPDPVVWGIDPYHRWFTEVWPGILQVHGTAVEFRYHAVDNPPPRFAWAFIDGDHRYEAIAADVLICRALEIPVLVFHDTAAFHKRMPDNHSSGSDARLVVRDAFGLDPGLVVLDVATESGLTIVCPPPIETLLREKGT